MRNTVVGLNGAAPIFAVARTALGVMESGERMGRWRIGGGVGGGRAGMIVGEMGDMAWQYITRQAAIIHVGV